MQVPQEVLREAERIVGFEFQDQELLALALTHASVADSRLESNERLEFLGDAALGMIVCDHLYHRFEEALEGELTKVKSTAVSRRMCAQIAKKIGLEDLIVLGKGMQTRQALPSSLGAAVLESIIGAIYIERGLDGVKAFLMPLLEEPIERAAKSGHQQNFKSVLQHVAQANLPHQPMYVLLDEKGPDHAKCFEVCVEIGAQRFQSRWAPSKKQAEQQAALACLEDLGVIVRDKEGHAVCLPHDEIEKILGGSGAAGKIGATNGQASAANGTPEPARVNGSASTDDASDDDFDDADLDLDDDLERYDLDELDELDDAEDAARV